LKVKKKSFKIGLLYSEHLYDLGIVNGGKLTHASPSRDRLMYVMTYLIGLRVEVHVKNGSVVSGIFHAANTDKDFGTSLPFLVYGCIFYFYHCVYLSLHVLL
jgi:Ataxin 2 SM domain